VARGERHLATVVAEKLLRRTLGQTSEALTSRELEVLSLVAQGLSNKRVAGPPGCH
jgi:DNA-binding NarL/FixJ family response regulator